MDARNLLHSHLDAAVLKTCIEAGWIVPQANGGLSEVDLARVQLIDDLKRDMGVNDEGITIILHLVDQLHGLRGALRAVLTAVRHADAMDFLARMRDAKSSGADAGSGGDDGRSG
jgi:chaperone modulatory protein CbpM